MYRCRRSKVSGWLFLTWLTACVRWAECHWGCWCALNGTELFSVISAMFWSAKALMTGRNWRHQQSRDVCASTLNNYNCMQAHTLAFIFVWFIIDFDSAENAARLLHGIVCSLVSLAGHSLFSYQPCPSICLYANSTMLFLAQIKHLPRSLQRKHYSGNQMMLWRYITVAFIMIGLSMIPCWIRS